MAKNKKEKYAQCTMERVEGSSCIRTTSYIPERFAKRGWILELKDSDGTWKDGWVVMSVGELTDSPPDWRALIKGHRKMTGDNLPKNS